MLPIKHLTHAKRARLLFSLAPEELPGFIAHCNHFIFYNYQHSSNLPELLSVPEPLFDSWFLLLQEVQFMLACEGHRMSRSPRAAGRILFSGRFYPFAHAALKDYAASKLPTHLQFWHLVRALFYRADN